MQKQCVFAVAPLRSITDTAQHMLTTLTGTPHVEMGDVNHKFPHVVNLVFRFR